MVHLLKEKSKIEWKAKDRKKYKALKLDTFVKQQKPINFGSESKKLDDIGPEAYLKEQDTKK